MFKFLIYSFPASEVSCRKIDNTKLAEITQTFLSVFLIYVFLLVIEIVWKSFCQVGTFILYIYFIYSIYSIYSIYLYKIFSYKKLYNFFIEVI